MPSPWPNPSMTERFEIIERSLPVSGDHKTLRILAGYTKVTRVPDVYKGRGINP